MIEGFLESAEPSHIRGWAFNPVDPGRHLDVEILCGSRRIGRVRANFYRQDLAASGVGGGDHAFLLTLDSPLAAAELQEVSGQVMWGATVIKRLDRLAAPSPTSARPMATWPRPSRDDAHRPVFILGSARSGTSAIAHGLLAATRYEGGEEGHFLDVLAPLAVGLHKFYVGKSDEWGGGRNTMIASVPQRFVDDALHDIAITAARAVFPSGLWLDKTPSVDMVYLAPRLRDIWPRARFIFMKRRAIENVASRLRKFPYGFAQNCREWTATMAAWSIVRESLSGVALELDQLALLRRPEAAAEAVARLLDLPEVERDRLTQQLVYERPQRTSTDADAVRGIERQEWTPDWRREFEEICGPMMDRFQYGRFDEYCMDFQNNGIVRI